MKRPPHRKPTSNQQPAPWWFGALLLVAWTAMQGPAIAQRPVHPVFAALDTPARSAPGWKSKYSGLSPIPLEELFPAGLGDDLEYVDLAVAIRRSLAYLEGQDASFVTEVGGRRLTIAQMRAALAQTEAQLNASKRLTLDELSVHFAAYRTRPGGDLGKATGYFEPVVSARLEPSEEFAWPIYPRPADLRRKDDTRRAIMFSGSMKGRAKPIAYLPTAVDVSVLQIQGSAVLELGDGTIGRVNYHAANGHPYRAIANALLDVIPLKEMSMEAIKAYLYANPDRWEDVLSHDPSYVFLRPVAEGPIGTIQQVVTAERSIAVDPRRVPLGSLCVVRIPSLDIARLVLAQDTGGAIKGPGRFDYFRGTGPAAAQRASAMNEAAELYVLLPRVAP